MTVLLAWMGFAGAAPGQGDWKALKTRANALMPAAANQLEERSGPNWAAFALRSGLEAQTVISCDAVGRLILRSGAQRATTPTADEPPESCAAALIVVDATNRRLLLKRDLLGRRALYWARVPDGVIASTSLELLLVVERIPKRPNPHFLAAHFAGVAPEDDATAYQEIRLVPGGTSVSVERARHDVQVMQVQPGTTSLTTRQAVEHARELIDQAVLEACHGAKTLGFLLSGGFDSGCLLARSQALRPELPKCAVTAGYTYPDVADERILAGTLATALEVRHLQMDAAGYVPDLCQLEDDWGPIANIFRTLNDASYARLRDAGESVLLTGQYADQLDAGSGDWVREPTSWPDHWEVLLPAAIPWLLKRSGNRVARLLRPRVKRQADWLQPVWRDYLNELNARRLHTYRDWPRPAQAAQVLGREISDCEILEHRHYLRHGLEARHPFRSLPLVRFVLSQPACRTRPPGQTKWIFREAMRGRMPEGVRTRKKCGTLLPLYELALETSGADGYTIIERTFAAADAYVQRDALNINSLRALADTGDVRFIRLLSFALWTRSCAAKAQLIQG